MEKRKYSFKTPKNVKVDYQDTEIEVVPFLSLETQLFLIKNYISDYFGRSEIIGLERDPMMAENGLMLGILDKCTSINIIELSIDEFLSNPDVYETILSKIVNYNRFRRILEETVFAVSNERQERMSVGSVIDDLYFKVSNLIDGLANVKIDDSALGKIKEAMTEINSSPVLGQALGSIAGANKTSLPKKNRKAAK